MSKEKASASLMILAVILRMACTAAVMLTIAQDWNWDMVPYGLPTMTAVHAFGILCMASMARIVSEVTKAPEADRSAEGFHKSIIVSVCVALIGCPISLLICWVCR